MHIDTAAVGACCVALNQHLLVKACFTHFHGDVLWGNYWNACSTGSWRIAIICRRHDGHAAAVVRRVACDFAIVELAYNAVIGALALPVDEDTAAITVVGGVVIDLATVLLELHLKGSLGLPSGFAVQYMYPYVLYR